MAKRPVSIFLLILLYVLLTSKSCVPETDFDPERRSEMKQDSLKQEIENVFESEYLFEEALLAFSEKARMKLQDFTDCLNLYADPRTDPFLKEQVKGMIFQFFRTPDGILRIFPPEVLNINRYPSGPDGLTDFLDDSGPLTYRFRLSEVAIAEPLYYSGNGLYSGLLQGHLTITAITREDTVMVSSNKLEAGMEAVRVKKSFGTDKSRKIWQVFLADLKIAE